jgi:hypothetical protein
LERGDRRHRHHHRAGLHQIIITINLITSTFIFTITTPSRCNILG